MELHADKPVAAPVVEDRLVTRSMLEKVLSLAGVATKSAIARALAPIGTRLSAVEARTGALSMIAGRGGAAENNVELDALLSTQRDLLARLDKSAATIESLERRASRHAEHLARLETRMKSVEQK